MVLSSQKDHIRKTFKLATGIFSFDMAREGSHTNKITISGDVKGADTALRKLLQQNRQLEKSLIKLDKSAGGFANRLNKFDKKVAQAAKGQKAFGKATGGLATSLKGATLTLGPYGLAAAAAGAAIWKTSEATFKAQTVFDNLTISIDAAKEATHGYVGEFDLAKQANAAVQLGVVENAKQFADLAGAAIKLGAAVGQEAAPSIESLVGALGRNSPLLLDNLGVSLKVSEAQSIYAKQLGKTTSALTESERALAFKTVGLQKVLEKSKSVTMQTGGLTASIRKLSVAASDLASKGFAQYEQRSITVIQAVRQMDEETQNLIKTMNIYGADQEKINKTLKAMGVEAASTTKLIEALAIAEKSAAEAARSKKIQAQLDRERRDRDWDRREELRTHDQTTTHLREQKEILQAQGGSASEILAKTTSISLMELKRKQISGETKDIFLEEESIQRKHLHNLELIGLKEKNRRKNLRATVQEAEALSRAISPEAADPRIGFRDPVTGLVEEDFRIASQKRKEASDEAFDQMLQYSERAHDIKEQGLILDINRAQRRAEIAEASGLSSLDPVKNAESSMNAELRLLEFRERNETDMMQIASIRDQREGLYHQRRLMRMEQEKKRIKLVKAAYIDFSAKSGRALMSASHAAIQASENKAQAFGIAVEGLAKSLAMEHSLRGASDLASAIGYSITFNAPAAAAHYASAGIHFAKAAAFGAIGVGAGMAVGGSNPGTRPSYQPEPTAGGSLPSGNVPRSGGGNTPRNAPGDSQPIPRSSRSRSPGGTNVHQSIVINTTGAIDEETTEKILISFKKFEQTRGSLNV